VASYLARVRGSGEPGLSIARVKDLEQFLRDAELFIMDHGEDCGTQGTRSTKQCKDLYSPGDGLTPLCHSDESFLCAHYVYIRHSLYRRKTLPTYLPTYHDPPHPFELASCTPCSDLTTVLDLRRRLALECGNLCRPQACLDVSLRGAALG